MPGRKRFQLPILIGLYITLPIAAIGTFWYFFIHIPVPSSEEAFKAKWQQVAATDRHHLLPWLLNADPKRYYVYELDQTRLDGLTISDVDELLGKPDRTSHAPMSVDDIDPDWGKYPPTATTLAPLTAGIVQSAR